MQNACFFFLLVPLALAGCHPPDSFREALAKGTPPVIDSVKPRLATNGPPAVIAEISFRSDDGNVVALHRELITADATLPRGFLSDTGVDVLPDQQKRGAVYLDRWSCSEAPVHARVRAYLIDSNHHHSNPVDYAIDCPG